MRLVAGGCLCCVGELEFDKQLRDILRSFRPARLLIEPSGAGHAADIVDALSVYESQRALRLDSVDCLIDALDAERVLRAHGSNEWSQIQSADVLLLSKPDLAGVREQQAFEEIAAAQYPAKRYLGSCRNGELPPAALAEHQRPASFTLVRAAGVSDAAQSAFCIGGRTGSETQLQQLGLWAVSLDTAARADFFAGRHRTAAVLAAASLCRLGTTAEGGISHGARTLVVHPEPRARALRRG